MNINVQFFGTIDKHDHDNVFEMDCPDKCTVGELAILLGFPSNQIQALAAIIREKRVLMNHVLSDGDAVCLFVPAGGG